MGVKSFRDPVTGVLKASGHVLNNDPGDIAQDEAPDFALKSREWRWDGRAWVPYTAPPPPPTRLEQALAALPDAGPLTAAQVAEVLRGMKDSRMRSVS